MNLPASVADLSVPELLDFPEMALRGMIIP